VRNLASYFALCDHLDDVEQLVRSFASLRMTERERQMNIHTAISQIR
jgi:hypothetical protein